jgi:group II intron reverse transcriptase/maturase
MSTTKPFNIPKHLVVNAFKAVKANAGAAGIDRQSIEVFEKEERANLYKIWNRMTSGSYFPPAVRAVVIPKRDGGERTLGIPTVADRVAQTVVKQILEPNLESVFLPDSYGYRPGKSAIDAIGITRRRCWEYNWVLEFDIKGLFDNIDHELLMRAVKKHSDCKWAILYIERWLKAPMQMPDGTLQERTKGTPQGGVISPCLANLFLHYAFDVWMKQHYPDNKWCRYADDGLVHCRSEQEAQTIKNGLCARLAECKLEMHPLKTKIIYCKDDKRTQKYPTIQFDFLGYTFRPRSAQNKKSGKMFVGFTPGVSRRALKSMRLKIRQSNVRNRTDFEIDDISKILNPVLRGWKEYYGKYYPSAMVPVYAHANRTLAVWAMRKFKRFRNRRVPACRFIERIAKQRLKLFVHWEQGILEMFA